MWLHVPSAYLPDVADSISPSPSLSQVLASSATWRGKSLRPASWRRVLRTELSTTPLSGLTCPPSMADAGVAQWISSWADFPALTSPSLASKPELPESTRVCGSNTCGSFARFNQDLCLLRTSLQSSLFPQEQPYSEGLPPAGSMRNGELFERPTLARRINGNGASSWPTPDTNTASYSNGQFGENLREKAATWPTPNSEDSECAGNHPGATGSLTGAIKEWRTPARSDSDRGPHPHADRKAGEHSLVTQADFWQTPATDSFRSRGGDRKDEMGLDQQARVAWPTPAASEVRQGFQDRSRGKKGTQESLTTAVYHSSLPAPATPPPGETSLGDTPGSRRRLNPAFAALLMSWPWWWTSPEPIASAPLAMASWQSKARRLLSAWLNGQGLISTGGGQ